MTLLFLLLLPLLPLLPLLVLLVLRLRSFPPHHRLLLLLAL